MLILLAAIINQKPIQTLRKRMRWETLLDVSDYQDVVSIVYIGLLGIEKEISEECEAEFYQSYKKQLLLYESYRKAEEVIKWQLERHKIEALFLMDSEVTDMYPKPEMAYIRQIEILVDKKDMPWIHRMMLDMDYEQKEEVMGSGVVYVRVPGVRIVFHDGMPIENKVIRHYFSGSVKSYRRTESYRFIHMLSNEEAYLYRMARMVELYIIGKLKIRDIMDLWQFEKLLGEKFRWKAVREYLEKARWQEFARQAELLAELWFGEGAEQQYGLAIELEEYILSRGRENEHLDEELLPCEKVRLDFYWRNRDKEWALKRQAWWFPSRDYMVQFFPALEKYPFLLAFYWIVRNWRFFRRICTNKCKKAGFRLRVRLSDIREKLKGLIDRKKDEDEETPEAAGEGAGSDVQIESMGENAGSDVQAKSAMEDTGSDGQEKSAVEDRRSGGQAESAAEDAGSGSQAASAAERTLEQAEEAGDSPEEEDGGGDR